MGETIKCIFLTQKNGKKAGRQAKKGKTKKEKVKRRKEFCKLDLFAQKSLKILQGIMLQQTPEHQQASSKNSTFFSQIVNIFFHGLGKTLKYFHFTDDLNSRANWTKKGEIVLFWFELTGGGGHQNGWICLWWRRLEI